MTSFCLARVKERTTFDIQKCGTTFNFDQTTVERLGIDDYYCPVDNTYSIAGTFYSPIFRYVELKFYK